MFAFPRIRLSWLTAALVVIGSAGAADAAWVTIKNDTKHVVVVQSTTSANGQMKRGKPMRLLPGESVREFIQPPAASLEVYDAQTTHKPLLTTNLAIKNENQTFSVASGNGGVIVSPVTGK